MAEQKPLPTLDYRTVGREGVKAAKAELERAKARAIRERLAKK